VPDDDTTAGPPTDDPADDPAPAAAGAESTGRSAGDRPCDGGDRPLLPDVTADERDVGWGDPYERDDDERFLREVPPHHRT
jgi:hypothetical protein